jgi:hypothetical protein
MTPPEKPTPPKPAELLPGKVPWGSRKPPAKLPGSVPPNLSAKQVPWGSLKTTKPGPPPKPLDPTVTHMPWAAPAPVAKPASPQPTARSVFAKLVPWSSRKATEPDPVKPSAADDSSSTTPSWALPKTTDAAGVAPAQNQAEMEFAREAQGQGVSADEPTAEQLVALLSKMSARNREPRASINPQAPYKARPISFDATQWEVFKMRAYAHRGRLSLTGVALLLVLGAVYLMKLVSLNAEIDRQWLKVDNELRHRYALAPAYVDCILSFSDNERYTLLLTEKALDAWHKAKTDEEIATAAAQMERVMIRLAKVMKRYEQSVPAPEPDQIESSALFAQLEVQKERSRAVASEMIQRYNADVEDFNSKVLDAPGSWIAWVARLHPRSPLFARAKE